VLTPEEAYIPQADPEDIYKYIAEDLLYAIENLPATAAGPAREFRKSYKMGS
jgi:hypothetical protein